MNEKKLCYSRDNETFNVDNIGDLMDDMASDDALEEGAVYYEADCTDMTHEYVVSGFSVDNLLEELDNSAYDDIGEVYGNDYYNVTKEAKDELRELLIGWARKHVALRYWRIDGLSREKTFTKEDVEEYFS